MTPGQLNRWTLNQGWKVRMLAGWDQNAAAVTGIAAVTLSRQEIEWLVAARIHEQHACIRCSLLRPDPAARARLEGIRDDLIAGIAEAEREGWLGEVEGCRPASPMPTTSWRSSTAAPATTATVNLGVPIFPGNR